MSVFSSESFDQHETVAFREDPESGLRAIIAVHNSALGPALGGCRMFPYASDRDALEDALRLSKGMTYKSALAGLPLGGGKAVIIGNPHTHKTEALMEAMGKFVDNLGGKYITAEDSGTSVQDMKIIGSQTSYVSGINDTEQFGGDPSPFTAYGIFCGIKACLQHKRGSDSLNGIRVGVQGTGAVGRYLIEYLIKEGAEVYAADIHQANLDKAVTMGAKAVSTDDILTLPLDVLSPCAMGAILNETSIAEINADIIAGGANNQLARTEDADLLQNKGILYAPDFVINAGGIIHVHYQNQNAIDQSQAHIENIYQTLLDIFRLADQQNISTARVAEQMAEAKIKLSH